jgi:hypothetical protein
VRLRRSRCAVPALQRRQCESRACRRGLCHTTDLKALSLTPVRDDLFDLASELSEVRGEAFVKLALLRVRSASCNLFRIVALGAQLLRARLHVLHGQSPWRLQTGRRRPFLDVRRCFGLARFTDQLLAFDPR